MTPYATLWTASIGGRLAPAMTSGRHARWRLERVSNSRALGADEGRMARAKASKCARFVVLDSLHIDRNVFETLAEWASRRGVRVQDAVQLALCAFNEQNREQSSMAPSLRTPLPSSAYDATRPPR
jgi:hypothetical protein